MSTSQVRIVLVDVEPWLSQVYMDADGYFSFDIDVDTSIAITKQVDEANAVGVLKQDTVRNFSLPITEKNAALLGDFGNPNAFNFVHEKAIKVKISVDLYELPENKIAIKRIGDQPYEVEAFGEANEWVSGLASMAIADLEFGTSPAFDWPWINDLHATKYALVDGELPVFVPYVNYGKRKERYAVSVEDLRIWHSPLFILKQAFCKLGYTFNCPILETDLGRRLWVYILAEDYANRSIATNKGFKATIAAFSQTVVTDPYAYAGIGGEVVFDNDSAAPAYDNGGFYSTVNGQYQGSNTLADFHAIIEITGTATPIPGYNPAYAIFLEKHNYTLGQYHLLDFYNSPTSVQTGTYTHQLNAINVFVSSDEVVIVRVIENGAFPSTINQYNSMFWNVPKATVIGRGDLIDLKIIIDPNYKVLELLKGVAHALDLKHETVSKVVSFYPEDGGILYAQGQQESFFRSNSEALDWTEKVQVGSLKSEISISKNKRNALLEFKSDGSDFKAKNTGFKFPLHSKNIDFGDSFKAGTEKYTNPFFAPTFNDFDFDVQWVWAPPFASLPSSAPYMPILWKANKSDNGVLPEAITKIEPRIVLAKRWQRMNIPEYKENSYPTTGDIRVQDNAYPTGYGGRAFYAPVSQIWPKGFTGQTTSGTLPLDDEAIVYGTDEYNPNLNGFYEIFYYQTLKRLYSTIPLEFLIKLSFLDFLNFSQRDKIYIKYFSKTMGNISFYARVSAVTDFVLNKNISTPVLLQPNSSRLDMSCCSCVVFVEGPFFSPPTVDFNALFAGNCGEIYSFDWNLTNIRPDLANLGIVGDDNFQTVKIGGNTSPALWHFLIEVTVETECGTVTASYEYIFETPPL